jgi:hypothetical protein
MHTVWVRLNAVVFFGLTVLLSLSILAALSKIGHANRPAGKPVITKLALNSLKSLKNHGGVDRALLSFDLHVSIYIYTNVIVIASRSLLYIVCRDTYMTNFVLISQLSTS